MESINPKNGVTIAKYQAHSKAQADQMIDSAFTHFLDWRKLSLKKRSELLINLKDLLLRDIENFALLMTNEMGKPILESKAEIEKCAKACEYYATHGPSFLQKKKIKTEASQSYVYYAPLGVILGIMPWNFPFWQAIRFAAPTLMAGNTIVLKHASNVSGCALELEKLFLKAGFPKNVFNTLLYSGSEMEEIIENPKIKGISLTGSTPAGKKVASLAGKHLKKCVLELGGSDPYLILADANLDLATTEILKSRFINNGQSCIAAKRIIAEASIYDQLKEKITKAIKDYSVGDPLNEKNKIGPMARKDLRDELHEQVEKSIAQGAHLVCGGKKTKTQDAFYPVTFLADVTSQMTAFKEELFGPVVVLIKAKDENDAIRLANLTDFGLGSAVFTNDQVKGKKIAEEELQAGSAFVNAMVKSDPRLPFGGTKESGFGRELSINGLMEFVNIKTVYIA